MQVIEIKVLLELKELFRGWWLQALKNLSSKLL